MCKSDGNNKSTTTVVNHFGDLPRLDRTPAAATAAEFHKPPPAADSPPPLVVSVVPSAAAAKSELFDDYGAFTAWPTSTEVVSELKQLGSIACPMVATGLLVYLRSMISMLFLGRLGDLELAGGALAIGFANITGYSVLSGLAMGMEPICGQAFGANKRRLMSLTLHRSILFLLLACFPIALLWLNVRRILLFVGQDPSVTAMAHSYLLFSLPDLVLQAVLNPVRIYLRTQKITLPISAAAALALSLHIPLNLLLVTWLQLGIRGVALAAVLTNFNLLVFLVAYVACTGLAPELPTAREVLREWRPLLQLALPSCVSVCLEWWWYELMIVFSGLLPNARAAVATMGLLIQTTALVYIFPSSLSQAVATRVGNELGARRPRAARTAALVAMVAAGLLGVAATSFTVSVRHVWGRLFTDDLAILELVALALPVVGVCEIGNCPQTTGCGVLRGTARPSLGANINLGSFYFVGMPVAMVLGFALNVGFVGLWFGLMAAQASCLVLMLLAIGRTDWVQQAIRAQELTGAAKADNTTHAAGGNDKCGSDSDSDSHSPRKVVDSSKYFELESLDDTEDEGEDKVLAGGNEQVPLVAVKVVRQEGTATL